MRSERHPSDLQILDARCWIPDSPPNHFPADEADNADETPAFVKLSASICVIGGQNSRAIRNGGL